MGMKKIGAFVGIFLVGLLMFGLVSGAGYNIVVPAADPPADPSSSGGGGGGGGAVTNVTNATSNETVISGEDIVDGEDASIDSGSGDSIGESIADIIDDAKKSWVWVGVVLVFLVAVVGTVVYFKKRQ